MSADGTLYVEEMYGDGWLAQHALAHDGTRVASVDEDEGARHHVTPLELPPDLVRPQRGWHSAALNFAGPRHRGLREAERVADLVRPVSVADKMALAGQHQLEIPPPMILGLAESFVLAEAALNPPHSYLVCRRVRFAYAMATVCTDAENQPYDYDTFVVYWAHVYHRERDEASALPAPDTRLQGVTLNRPMDCLLHGDQLVIADGGDARTRARLHLWRLANGPATPQHPTGLPRSSTES